MKPWLKSCQVLECLAKLQCENPKITYHSLGTGWKNLGTRSWSFLLWVQSGELLKSDFKLRPWPVVTCWFVRPIRDNKTRVENKWDDNDKGKTKCRIKPDQSPLFPSQISQSSLELHSGIQDVMMISSGLW